MIPVKEMRVSFEKIAATDSSLGSKLGDAITYAARNPMKLLFPAALFAGGVMIANHIWPKTPITRPGYSPDQSNQRIVFPLA
jgi:hypothetical protein